MPFSLISSDYKPPQIKAEALGTVLAFHSENNDVRGRLWNQLISRICLINPITGSIAASQLQDPRVSSWAWLTVWVEFLRMFSSYLCGFPEDSPVSSNLPKNCLVILHFNIVFNEPMPTCSYKCVGMTWTATCSTRRSTEHQGVLAHGDLFHARARLTPEVQIVWLAWSLCSSSSGPGRRSVGLGYDTHLVWSLTVAEHGTRNMTSMTRLFHWTEHVGL